MKTSIDNAAIPPAKPHNLRGSIRSLFWGLVVGAIFMALAFRRTAWQSVATNLQSVDRTFIFYGIIIYAIYLLIRTWRWSCLLADRTENRPFWTLFRAVTWGNAANAVIPHSGEVLRALATRQPLALSTSSIIGSIAAERLYDFGAVILVTSVVLATMSNAPPVLRKGLVTLTVMAGCVIIPVISLAFQNPMMIDVIKAVSRLLPSRIGPKFVEQVGELSAGLRSALTNSRFLLIVLLSVAQWILIAVCIDLSLAALHLNLPFWVALIILPLTLAGLTLPSAPAYLGTMQICFMAGLMPFGVSDETAIATSMTYLSIVTFPVMIGSALWYLLYVAIDQCTV